jgi:hypothetical protein
MRKHRWLFITGLIMIPVLLAGCGQKISTGGGSAVASTTVPSPAATKTTLPTAPAGVVSLSVGAMSYHSTDTISVTLSNQSTQAIYFPDHLTNCTVIQLQRQVQGTWENVNICLLLTPTALHRLDAGKALAVALAASSARPWIPGLYRATLRYSTSPSLHGPTTITSAEFKVLASGLTDEAGGLFGSIESA